MTTNARAAHRFTGGAATAWRVPWDGLSEQDVAPALLFIVLAALACLTPVKNDTWWHLRSGQEMWETGRWLVTETFSFTSNGAALHNHWWVSQLAFFGAYSLGGAFGLSLFAGACALGATFGSWRLMRGGWEARLVLLVWLLLVCTPGWGIRPQVVSLAFVALTAWLIAQDRIRWLPVVFVVWANAHALVILGVAMAGALVIEALVWSRERLKQAMVVTALSVAAPVLSPLGLEYWPRVASTVSLSRQLQIEEYRLPLQWADLQFWIGLAAVSILLARGWKTLAERAPSERALILSALVLGVAGASAARNGSIFAIVAAPVISWLLPGAWAGRPFRARRASRGAAVLLTCAAALAAIAVSVRWRSDTMTSEWQPLSAGALAAVQACPEPMFNRFDDGGYLMWVMPDRPVFVDSRIEAYSADLLRQSRAADVYGRYEEPFGRYGIKCALVGTGSPMFARLTADSRFRMTHSDSARSVFSIR